MSIVQRIPQSGSIFGKANAQGIVIADPTWYLFLYNLSLVAQTQSINQFLYGTVAPTAGIGADGDFYIDTTTYYLYGPQASGTWPAGVSLVGPAGTNGTNGNTVLYGTVAPTAGIGADGNFYIDTVTNYLYGPKASGTWPAGVSLVGPAGPAVGSYFTPVAWNGSTDRVLGVGQITQDSFTSATSIPLHITCGDGQIYEIELNGKYTPSATTTSTIVQPNNAAPTTNSFTLYQMYGANSTPTANYYATLADGGFRFDVSGGLFSGTAKVFTSTAAKSMIAHSAGGTSTNTYCSEIREYWNDTTTVWSSLGTITMPNAWTGQIVCKRIA